MKPRILLAAGACLCLWLASPVPAGDFAQTVADVLRQEKSAAAVAMRGLGGARPEAALPAVLGFDPNVPSALRRQTLADLAFVAGIRGQGASRLHAAIFGPVDGSTYIRWFLSRVRWIGMDWGSEGLAYAMAGPKLWLTRNYVNRCHAQVFRVAVLFHEARHTEFEHRYWPHALCPRRFTDEAGDAVRSLLTGELLAGEPACDATPLGSYGTELAMLKNIQRFCANCTEKVLMDAGLFAEDSRRRMLGDAQAAVRADLKP